MKTVLMILILLTLTVSACNLASTEDPTREPLITPSATGGFPTLIVRGSPSPSTTRTTPTATRTQALVPTACSLRTDWPQYTVVSGDTLSGLAARTGTTAAALLSGNCLSSDLIITGQRLYVPRSPITPTPSTVPQAQPLQVQPIKRDENGMWVLYGASVETITWRDFPNTTAEVRFYTVPTGTGMWDCCRSLIGTDTSVTTGEAVISWTTPSSLPGVHLVAEAVSSTGASLLMSDTRLITVEPTALIAGTVTVDQQLSGDAGIVMLLRNATATVQYTSAPTNLARVHFWFIYDGGTKVAIGTDDNASDGYRATWTIPYGLNGTLTAYGYDVNDNVVVMANGLQVVSGSAPGQGCRITMNAVTNTYEEPNTLDQPAVGSLNINDTVETLGRSLAGWWAYDPSGKDGADGVDSLVWIPVDATVTQGANCS